jgi:type IX secretion system PorP/SprF family membrane protein
LIEKEMKKELLLAVLVAFGAAVKSQNAPQVSYFMYDHLRTNPGSAGSNDMICANLIGRLQFSGFPGAPTSAFAEIDMPFKLLGTQHGAGITVYNDAIGFNKVTNLNLSYAYRISVGDGTLGIGLQGGMYENKLTPTWHPPGGDPSGGISNSDIPQGDADGMSFNLSAGLFYRTEDIYFGASVINLNNPEVTTTSQSNSGGAKYNLPRQFYVTAGYSMQLANPAYELKPAVLLKSDGVATDMDLNLTLMYNKKIWGGVSYRTGEAIVGMVGLELMENLKVGYAYDFATSVMSKYSKGSHEVLLNYCFKIGVEKAPQKYKSIRFL